MCVSVCTRVRTHLEWRGRGSDFLLPSCESWDSDSGEQVWWRAPFRAEPSRWPGNTSPTSQAFDF